MYERVEKAIVLVRVGWHYYLLVGEEQISDCNGRHGKTVEWFVRALKRLRMRKEDRRWKRGRRGRRGQLFGAMALLTLNIGGGVICSNIAVNSALQKLSNPGFMESGSISVLHMPCSPDVAFLPSWSFPHECMADILGSHVLHTSGAPRVIYRIDCQRGRGLCFYHHT